MSFRHQKDWKTLYFKSTSERNQCTQTQEHEPILYFKLSAALRLNDRDSTCLALPWEPPLLGLTNTSLSQGCCPLPGSKENSPLQQSISLLPLSQGVFPSPSPAPEAVFPDRADLTLPWSPTGYCVRKLLNSGHCELKKGHRGNRDVHREKPAAV